MKKVISILLSLVLIFGQATLVLADGNEYAAVYASNFDPEDAQLFAQNMRANGWITTKETWKGMQSDILGLNSIGDETDFLYWSSHGYASGQMSYYDSSGNYNDASNSWIGNEYVGSQNVSWDSTNGYKSNSKWDTDLEWTILATCSQFVDDTNRRRWASTLLGYPHRAHSIWGYTWYNGDQSAPAGNSVKYSWLMANRDEAKSNWAGLTHYANRYDRLWGMGTTYSSTSIYEVPNIRYYWEAVGDVVYGDGQLNSSYYASTNQPSSLFSSLFNIISTPKPLSNNLALLQPFSNLMNLFDKYMKSDVLTAENSSRFKETKITRSIEKNNKKININSTVLEPVDLTIPLVSVIEDKVNEDDLISSYLKENKNNATKTELKGAYTNIKQYKFSDKSISFRDDGTVSIVDHELTDEEEGIKRTKDDSLKLARKFLKENNFSDGTEYIVTNSSINEQRIDVNTEDDVDDTGSVNTLAHIFTFGHKINDIPISILDGDRINVMVDNNGVSWSSKKWSKVIENKSGKKKIISANDAINKLEDTMNTLNISNEVNIKSMTLTYKKEKVSSEQGQYELQPQWELYDEEGRPYIIDAITGEVR